MVRKEIDIASKPISDEFSDPTPEEQVVVFVEHACSRITSRTLKNMLWLSSIEPTSALGDSAEFGP
jgi:hypothetical protein